MLLRALIALIANVFRLVLAPVTLLRRARAAPPGAFVHLVVDGALVATAVPASRLPWAAKARGLPIDRVRALVDELIADPRPAGLLVTIKTLSAAPAHRTALRAELARLRAAGRRVVLHLPYGGSTPELLLASAADRVLVGAETMIGPLGFRSGTMYFRAALDRVGLVPDVHAEGQYKSAGEPLMRDTMSDAQAEQSGRLLDVLHDELVTALVDGRGLTREAAIAFLDRGIVTASALVEAKVADLAVHDDDVAHQLGPTRVEKAARIVPARRYLLRRAARLFYRVLPRPRIAVLELHGPIVERSPMNIGDVCEAERIVPMIDALADMPFVPAVVLHVDSPGGGVLASEKIHRAVARLAAKKPVVACFGGVAASGGYYVSAPAACIVAAPTTITGSIGVVAARVLVGPLLARLGITPQVVTRGAHADMLSMVRPFDDAEKAAFDGELDRAYRRFLSLVAEGRHRTEDEIRPLAGGRVWAGRDALEHGLVDRLGGLDVALAEARSRAGFPDAEALLIARPSLRPPPLLRLLRASALESLGLGPAIDLANVTLGTRERVWALASIDSFLR
jgi:protease-4